MKRTILFLIIFLAYLASTTEVTAQVPKPYFEAGETRVGKALFCQETEDLMALARTLVASKGPVNDAAIEEAIRGLPPKNDFPRCIYGTQSFRVAAGPGEAGDYPAAITVDLGPAADLTIILPKVRYYFIEVRLTLDPKRRMYMLSTKDVRKEKT